MADAGSSLPRSALPTRWGRLAACALPYLLLVGFQALAVRVLAFEAFESEGPSMQPTLVDGDRFVVDKGAYGIVLPSMSEAIEHWADPTPGDVVVLCSPAGDVDIVKRVIGVPGDRVEIVDGEVFVNGESIRRRILGPCADDEGGDPTDCELAEEGLGAATWRIRYSLLSPTESYAAREVPPGHVFVLGDHRDHSNDSRNPRIGFVPVTRLRGRAVLIYWGDEPGRAGTWIE